MNRSFQNFSEENRELKERLFQCEQALYQSQELIRRQKTWLDLMGDEKVYKLAHLFMRIKKDFFGSSYSRTHFMRWIRKKEPGQSSSNYVYQLQKLRDDADFVLCAQAGPACTSLDQKELDYYRFKRRASLSFDFRSAGMSQTAGLVSIVLPVYNGGEMLNAAIESILQQTYKDFELIIVDDGSTDGTPALVDEWARRDSRIRVIHQPNQKIPRTLNNGFASARGEYLTWTSADNNLHPDFLQKMIHFMAQHPHVALCYANMRLIDESGAPILENNWYPAPDDPSVVCLPEALLRLNSHPENLVGAAFMYRRILPALIGGYDPALYTVEDYDYWLRISDFFNVCHVDFSEPVYDYRLHKNSLTAHAKELRINEMRNRMMYLEVFRQRIISSGLCWQLSGDRDAADRWRTLAAEAGHTVLPPEKAAGALPYMAAEFSSGPAGQTAVFRFFSGEAAPGAPALLRLRIGPPGMDLSAGELWASDLSTAFQMAEVFAKATQISLQQHRSVPTKEKGPDATIVYCCSDRTSAAPLQKQMQQLLSYISGRIRCEILVLAPDTAPWNTWARQNSLPLTAYESPQPDPLSVWEFALHHARGRWVLPLDDSMILDPAALQYFAEDFRRDPQCALIAGNTGLVSQDPPLPAFLAGSQSFPGSEYARFDPAATLLTGQFFAFRRQALLDAGGFPGHWNGYFFSAAVSTLNCLARTLELAGFAVGYDPRATCLRTVVPDCRPEAFYEWAGLLHALLPERRTDFTHFADTVLPDFIPACQAAGVYEKVLAYLHTLQTDDLADAQSGREVLLQEVLR